MDTFENEELENAPEEAWAAPEEPAPQQPQQHPHTNPSHCNPPLPKVEV